MALAGLCSYTTTKGKPFEQRRSDILAHLFNHQTHHRGQVTTLLSQMGLDIGSTDIPFMPGFEHNYPVALENGFGV